MEIGYKRADVKVPSVQMNAALLGVQRDRQIMERLSGILYTLHLIYFGFVSWTPAAAPPWKAAVPHSQQSCLQMDLGAAESVWSAWGAWQMCCPAAACTCCRPGELRKERKQELLRAKPFRVKLSVMRGVWTGTGAVPSLGVPANLHHA